MSITIYKIRNIEPHEKHKNCSGGVEIEFSVKKFNNVALSVLGYIVQSKCCINIEFVELKVTNDEKWVLSVVKNDAEGYSVSLSH